MAPKRLKIEEMELKNGKSKKMLEDLKGLEFTMTNKMKEQLFRLIFIKQTLEDENLSFKEQKLLQKEFDSLLADFRKEFQANNKIQVHIVRKYLNME